MTSSFGKKTGCPQFHHIN